MVVDQFSALIVDHYGQNVKRKILVWQGKLFHEPQSEKRNPALYVLRFAMSVVQ